MSACACCGGTPAPHPGIGTRRLCSGCYWHPSPTFTGCTHDGQRP